MHRADAERWMDWQQTTVGPPMGILFRGLLRSPRDAIETAELKQAERKAGAALAILDAQLARHRYVTGESLTVADIALGYVPHRWFKLPIDRVDLPRLKRWHERLCDRSEYQKHIATA